MYIYIIGTLLTYHPRGPNGSYRVRSWVVENKLSMKERKCTDCNKFKSNDEFYKDSTKTSGYKSYCKKCSSKRAVKFTKTKEPDYTRNVRLKNVYGITLEQYNQMFESQNGSCKLCGKHQTEFKRALAVDHCHKSNNVRSLLCHKCNGALGLVDDNIDTLNKMISYLIEHNSHSCPQ